jgi:hypothetical protein
MTTKTNDTLINYSIFISRTKKQSFIRWAKNINKLINKRG